MMRPILMIAAVCATLAAATTMLRSHPHAPALAATGMTSLHELNGSSAARRLGAEDYEDMSFIYTSAPQPTH